MSPKLPGISSRRAVRAFEKAGFRVLKRKRHIIMSDGEHYIIIPRDSTINAYTMAGIINDAGFTIEEFKKLL